MDPIVSDHQIRRRTNLRTRRPGLYPNTAPLTPAGIQRARLPGYSPLKSEAPTKLTELGSTADCAEAAGSKCATDKTAARAFAAISGATVVLQRSGASGFTSVLEADPGIMPNVNPQITNGSGRFQWDVAAGTYRVEVSANGYTPVTSREVVIPPPVLDLFIAMTKIEPPVPQPQTANVKVPKKIKFKGKTVLLKKAVVTNAGQTAKVKVSWSTKKSAKAKAKRYAKVTKSSKGKVTIKTKGKARKALRQVVAQSAGNRQLHGLQVHQDLEGEEVVAATLGEVPVPQVGRGPHRTG